MTENGQNINADGSESISHDQILSSPREAVQRFSPFEEGVIDGVIRVDPIPFQNFIEHSENADLTEKQIAENQRRMLSKEAEYHQVKTDLLKWKKLFFENSEADLLQQEKITHLEAERHELDTLIQQSKNRAEGIKMEFSIFPALLFFGAAIVFIIADVFFTNQVVGYLFDMQDDEGLLIAIGLAGITFLIKPAIDRMLEKPYRDNRHVKRVHGFYLFVGIAALVMLGYLGYLRLEGVGIQGASNVNTDTTVTLDMLQNNGGQALSDTSTIDQIIHGFPSQVLFIMSSLLFALAGAVCLSISLPNLTLAERKIRYRALVRIYKKKGKDILKSIEYIRIKQNEYKVASQEADLQISLLRPLDVVESEWNALVRESDQLAKELSQAEIQKEKALYVEGYGRGTKFNMNGDLYFSPYQVLRRVFMRAKPPRGNGRSRRETNEDTVKTTAPSKRGDYLHQEIRRMIDFTFTKNHNDTYNDEYE